MIQVQKQTVYHEYDLKNKEHVAFKGPSVLHD